tara:strand:+ start:43 stop:1206 length:1164 start_codon:yes stop_codon:yes gene_type:complete
MKSLINFLIEARGGPDFSDEKSHEILWNYLVDGDDDEIVKKVRKAIKDKDWDVVGREVNNIITKSQSDLEHPLHFDNQGDDGFTGGSKTDDHRNSFNSRIERSKHGVISMLKSRQGSSMASKGWRVTQQGGEHQRSKSDWSGNPGGQGRTDLVYTDPDNPKAVHRQSQKDVRGSQAYSAGGDQFAATVKAGAKEITKPKFDKPRKEKDESDQDYKSRVTKIKTDAREVGKERQGQIGRQAERTGKLVDSMKGKSTEDKQRLKGLASRMTGRMERQNPGLSKAAGQEALTGKAQFGGKVDSVITTGDERSSVKDPRATSVGNPRPALPKGRTRGGNVKGDIKPEQSSRPQQGNFRDFQSKIAERQRGFRAGQATGSIPKRVVDHLRNR